MAIKAALHGDGLRHVDVARTGIGVQIETCVADVQRYRTAAGGEFSIGDGLAVCFNIT